MPDPYQPENIPLFEALYGRHLISLGGVDAIDNMFSDVHLEQRTALDIGFGLGGVAVYLAEKHRMEVSGVEIHPWMVKHAANHAPNLHFATYEPGGKIPFTKNHFDLAYSKGVLNHVHDKLPLFHEVRRCLKPHGKFIIADWIYPEKEEKGPLVRETESSYRNLLDQAGFKKIAFRNDTRRFIAYIGNLFKNLDAHQDFIITEYGREFFSTIKHDHLKMLKEIEEGSKIAVRISSESVI